MNNKLELIITISIVAFTILYLTWHIGRLYEFNRIQKEIINFTETMTYNKVNNTNCTNNNNVDLLLDSVYLDH